MTAYYRSGPLDLAEYKRLSRYQRLKYQAKHNPRRLAELCLLFFMLFVEWLGATMVAPIIPWLITDLAPTMKAGAAAAILMSSYIAGTFVSSLISGPLSDRIGRRPVFIGGLLIYTSSFFLVANSWNIASFASFRALSGLATGLRPVMIAYLSETSLHDDMPFYGMIMSTVVSLGVSLGPVVGGALALWKLRSPFYLSGIVSALLLIAVCFVLRETHSKQLSELSSTTSLTLNSNTSTIRALLFAAVAALSIGSLCSSYLNTAWTTIFGLLAPEWYGLDSATSGIALGIQGLFVLLIGVAYVFMIKILKPALIGAIGYSISCLLIIVPFVHQLYVTIVLGVCCFIGCSLYFSGVAYYMAVISPPHKRGLISSIVMCSSNLGSVCGPLISGALYDDDPHRHAYPFYAILAISLTGVISCIVIHRVVRSFMNINH